MDVPAIAEAAVVCAGVVCAETETDKANKPRNVKFRRAAKPLFGNLRQSISKVMACLLIFF
jgi:hypothetical protein